MSIFNDIVNEVTQRVNGLQDALIEGTCKSLEEYKSLVGEIRGLSFAKQLLIDLVRKMESDEDE